MRIVREQDRGVYMIFSPFSGQKDSWTILIYNPGESVIVREALEGNLGK